MRRRGFTIVELLVVIAVIAILMSIVVVAAQGAIRNARAKRASAMAVALESGLSAYYAQVGSWPDAIEAKAKSMTDDTYMFTADETDQIFRQLLQKTFGKGQGQKSMMVDATALFVVDRANLQRTRNSAGCYDNHRNPNLRHSYCGNQRCPHGVDFTEATRKGGKYRIQLNNMAVGYPGTEFGCFRRFWLIYNAKTDSVSVSKDGPNLQ